MFYQVDKNGKYKNINVFVCDFHYKHWRHNQYYIEDDVKSLEKNRCCALLYDGTRCVETNYSYNINDEKKVRLVDKKEIDEINNIFKKLLKINMLSKLQFENFNRMIFLLCSTTINEIFNGNHNISTPLSIKYQTSFGYFLEKLTGFCEDFNFKEINRTENLNDILPQYIVKDSLYQIPIKYPKIKMSKNEKFMYRNFIIFVNLLYCIVYVHGDVDRNPRGAIYNKTFFNETLVENSYIKNITLIFSALFNQLNKFKDSKQDIPILHTLLEEEFHAKFLPNIMNNLRHQYEMKLLEDSFQ